MFMLSILLLLAIANCSYVIIRMTEEKFCELMQSPFNSVINIQYNSHAATTIEFWFCKI